jgi:cytochrome b subunit of formate dehydrogenase
MTGNHLVRHSSRARWFHALVYIATLPLTFTGLWLLSGSEGHPSPLSRIAGMSDARLHLWLGRVLAVLVLVPLVAGRKAIVTFVRETFRRDRGDAKWWARWPAASFTGKFARHEGHFDPGQRVANVLIVGGLAVLTVTGIAMTALHGGSTFATVAKIHRATAYLFTAVIVGHMLIAAGLLPGYRGVWRSMHLGGKLRVATARRIWPGWTERSAGAGEVKP